MIAESSDETDNQAAGAKQAAPFPLASQTGTYQQNIKQYKFPINNSYRPSQNRRCPACDSSVYPYCAEKLLHDACCCTDPYIHDLPYQCRLADCRFLHANTCREHKLIATCCCSDDYRSLLKNFSDVQN
ncbi:PREDICTED: uncharacterized protein LOC107188154 [Dufourea novaeangliae]|uniref:uncharacterized protein LOC107188154 n=1 Tax=Dufourea novaeangliae TaxID=178035 RepID=UPI000766FDDC|nr:PREDICTED: uncharacterized protein LOC107188154 [Dufourea novaeangliae]